MVVLFFGLRGDRFCGLPRMVNDTVLAISHR